MNELIKELYLKSVERNWAYNNEFETAERFTELIVQKCCDWIDGSPSTDAGQLLLTKSFIIANLKGLFENEEAPVN